MKKLIRNEDGFTLFETVVVLAVLAIFIVASTEVMLVSNRLLQNYNMTVNDRSSSSIAISHIDTSLKRYDVKNSVFVYDKKIFILTNPGGATPLFLTYYYREDKETIYSCSVTDMSAPINTDDKTCTYIARNIVSFSAVPEQNDLTNTTMITLTVATKNGDNKVEDKRVITLKAN